MDKHENGWQTGGRVERTREMADFGGWVSSKLGLELVEDKGYFRD